MEAQLTPALSDTQIDRLWKDMLGAEVRALYFAELVGRLNQRQRRLTMTGLAASSGAVVSFVLEFPGLTPVRTALPLIAAAANLVLLVQQYQRSAVDAADLHFRWQKLAKDYEKLWENVYADDAGEQLESLTGRATDISRAGNGFPYEPKVMLRWEQHVIQHRLPAQS